MESQETIGKLSASLRTSKGKGVARKLRDAGMTPAVVYGGDSKEALSLAIDPLKLQRALDPQKKENTLIELTIESPEGGEPKRVQVMLKEYQIDPIKQTLLHADFIHVALDKPIRVEVPMHLEGRPEGVKLGGTLHQIFRTLPVECTPERIPAFIVAEVSSLKIGATLDISALPLPEGVRVCLPPQQTCVLVMAPRAAVAEEAAVEGAGVEAATESKAS